MNMISKIMLGASLAITSMSAMASFTLPEYQKVTLDNGLTVYLMEQKEVPLIDVSIMVKTGSVADEKAGTAHMTAGAMMLGTQSQTRAEFEAAFDFVGSTIATTATHEYTQINVSMASKDWSSIMPMVVDALTRPKFDMKEFDDYKARHLLNLAQQQESPRQMIGKFFNAQMYGDHPYANNTDGAVSSVEQIELADIKRFHRDWFTPDNSAVVVVGDINAIQIKASLTELFGKWTGKSAQKKSVKAPIAPQKAGVLLVNKGDANESTFMIGGPGIQYDNPDYVAISIINTVLGARFTSWLNDELRVNSGLTYGARSRFSRRMNGGTFYISSFTRTETTVEALDLALKTYARLWEKGIDEETLASAKAYVKGQFPPDFETSAQLAALLGQMFVYGFDEQFINTFTDQVNQLDGDKASKLINQYFPRENLQFVIVGNAEAIKEQVAKYGDVVQKDITSDI